LFQEKELPYHFVSFVPVNGRLWEIDGLQKGPIDHGEISCPNWIDAARPVLQTRMAQYQEGEVHFNLMACCEDRLMRLEKKLAAETMDFPKTYVFVFQNISYFNYISVKFKWKSKLKKRSD
jgi:ubiquitin carboxyl-terminal hydrolase L5